MVDTGAWEERQHSQENATFPLKETVYRLCNEGRPLVIVYTHDHAGNDFHFEAERKDHRDSSWPLSSFARESKSIY